MDEEEKARRVQELYREALDLAEQAVLADKQKQFDVAICLYNEASNVFNQIIDEDLETEEKIIQIQQKANEYVTRANYLTVKNMNNSQNNIINANNVSDLPSLYHIVGSFVDNGEGCSSRPSNSYNNNDINNSFGSDSYSFLNQTSGISNASPNTSMNESFNINTAAATANNNATSSNGSSPYANNENSPLNINTTNTTTTNNNNNNASSNNNNNSNSPTSITGAGARNSTSSSIASGTTNNKNQNVNASEEFNDKNIL